MRTVAVLSAALAVVVGTACGGGGGGTTKEAWRKEHGRLVAAFGRDIDAAGTALDQGERSTTIGACTQLSEDAKEVRKEALPVPDPASDAALRRAVDTAAKAAASCLQGARSGQGADAVEAAQREIADARRAIDEADAALAAWK